MCRHKQSIKVGTAQQKHVKGSFASLSWWLYTRPDRPIIVCETLASSPVGDNFTIWQYPYVQPLPHRRFRCWPSKSKLNFYCNGFRYKMAGRPLLVLVWSPPEEILNQDESSCDQPSPDSHLGGPTEPVWSSSRACRHLDHRTPWRKLIYMGLPFALYSYIANPKIRPETYSGDKQGDPE